MTAAVYHEQFDDGPGGWYGWISNAGGPKPLEWQRGSLTSRSPWWIDYNHAPPGAGYLHMVFCLATAGPRSEACLEAGGTNRFLQGGYPANFSNASISVRLSGELVDRHARLLLLIQGNAGGITSGWLLTQSPLAISASVTEQTIHLEPDAANWTALGVRHDRADMYGVRPLDHVLRCVNVNLMLVLFPLDIVPMGTIDGDPDILRPERDYPVWRHRLPEGYITLEGIRIQFAD